MTKPNRRTLKHRMAQKRRAQNAERMAQRDHDQQVKAYREKAMTYIFARRLNFPLSKHTNVAGYIEFSKSVGLFRAIETAAKIQCQTLFGNDWLPEPRELPFR